VTDNSDTLSPPSLTFSVDHRHPSARADVGSPMRFQTWDVEGGPVTETAYRITARRVDEVRGLVEFDAAAEGCPTGGNADA
jgi:hypothetical protein